ncbi:Cytochrome P450 monooxygenase ATR2 [Paramyrothecium foliicola]|nr:Cytochrome P450 monooxygenase ATR2 [Paramyrothecium foliicola]
MPVSILSEPEATVAVTVDRSPVTYLINKMPLVTSVILACVAVLCMQIALSSEKWAGIPIVGTQHGGSASRRKKFVAGEAKNLYLEGYRKFKAKAFQITTANKLPNIVIAPKFMDELKKLPDDVLSFNRAIEESMHTKYTGMASEIDLVPHTIKNNLTPALPRLNPIVAGEVAEIVRSEFPHSSDWTEVKIMEKILRIVAMAVGRISVGPGLCRQEDYVSASINYTVDLMEAVRVVSETTPWLRPFLASRTPEVKKVKQYSKEVERILKPVITARREAANNPDYQKPDDILQWVIDAPSNFERRDDSELAQVQLSVSFAAIHTTTVTATNALYTLAAMPELIPVFLEEIQSVLNENNEIFTSKALQDMKKVDSFLKENERYYETGFTSFKRKVLKSFSLSNGQIIPAGAIIELPSIGINNDADYFPDHDRFDALRFYKLREAKSKQVTGTKQAEVVANAQFISTGPSSLTFGYGRHACPGRFFAVNEIKMILATILLNYDIKNMGPERYPNLGYGEMVSPDPERKILLKRISS